MVLNGREYRPENPIAAVAALGRGRIPNRPPRSEVRDVAVYVCVNYWPEMKRGPSEAAYLRRLGATYRRAAGLVAKLEADGWVVDAHLEFAFAHHPDVRRPGTARRRLAALGIDPKDVEVNTTESPAKARKQLARRS